MTVPVDVNTHTLSGTLFKDAAHRALTTGPDSPPTKYRFKFRMGTRKVFRQGNDVRTRMTWFTVKFEVPAAGLDYYKDLLKANTRVFVTGEQLTDEEDSEAGRRYWHFIKATAVQLLQAPPVAPESTSDDESEHEYEHVASNSPRQPAHQERPPARSEMPPAPRPERQAPERTIAPSRAPMRQQERRPVRGPREIPEMADRTHFDPNSW
jgi:hypothetical protein